MYVQDPLASNPYIWAPNLGRPLLSQANPGDRAELSQVEEVQRGDRDPGCQDCGTESLLSIWNINLGI